MDKKYDLAFKKLRICLFYFNIETKIYWVDLQLNQLNSRPGSWTPLGLTTFLTIFYLMIC